MKRREKSDLRGLKVTFEAVAGRQGGRGIFAIEDEAEEVARRTKLAQIAERIAAYDQGYGGGRHCQVNGSESDSTSIYCGHNFFGIPYLVLFHI
jgi:hypothetical protein